MSNKFSITKEVMSDLSLVAVPDSFTGELNYKPGDWLQYDVKVIKTDKAKRSALMNACVHKYCQMLADLLNAYGYQAGIHISVGGTVESLAAPWTMIAVKETIFKPVLKAASGVDGTSKATNAQLCEAEEKIGQFFAEKADIQIVWPSNQPPAWR